MSPGLLTVLVFVAGALIVAGVYSLLVDLFFKDRARLDQRIDEAFSKKQRDRVQRSPLFKDLSKLASQELLENPRSWRIVRWFEAIIEQSGMDLTPRLLLGIMAGAAAFGGPVVGFCSQNWIAGVVVGLLAFIAPLVYVNWKRKKRLEKFLSQLPDALELMSRLIRAGKTISAAFQGVADEFQPPLAAEFAYCYEQQNLGLSPEVALRDLARRVGLVEMRIFVLAIIIQRQTGGNLAELIDNLSGLIRERFRIKGKIRILTAEGRMEAAVLLAMPPVVLGLILWLNRDYGLMLFDHPKLLWMMGGMMLTGVLWIRRIINFDF